MQDEDDPTNWYVKVQAINAELEEEERQRKLEAERAAKEQQRAPAFPHPSVRQKIASLPKCNSDLRSSPGAIDALESPTETSSFLT
jgi:hypothetical protein